VDKIAEKEVCTSVFLTALYFECRINKNALLQSIAKWLWRATRVFI